MQWFLSEYAGVARSGGIYNCRAVRGSAARSVHSEGRALDVMMPVVRGRGHAAGHDAIARLGKVGDRLGITLIIFDRMSWSQRNPSGSVYKGQHPHYDHLHVEITREAAESLTLEQIRRIVGGGAVPLLPGVRTLRSTRPVMRGDDVRAAQKVVRAPEDGVYGPMTAGIVSSWQARNGLVADGIVGPKTWRAMGF
jgi:hypothetical protein